MPHNLPYSQATQLQPCAPNTSMFIQSQLAHSPKVQPQPQEQPSLEIGKNDFTAAKIKIQISENCSSALATLRPLAPSMHSDRERERERDIFIAKHRESKKYIKV